MLETASEIRRYVEDELRRVLDVGSMWRAEALLTTEVRSGDPVPRGPNSLLWHVEPRESVYQGWFTLEASPESREFLIWYGSTHAGVAGAQWIMRPAVHVPFGDLRLERRGRDGPDFSLGGVLISVLHQSDRYPLNDFSYA